MDTTAPSDTSMSHALEAHPLRGLASISTSPRVPGQIGSLDWRQALGMGLIGIGTIAVIVAWWGVSGTLDPGKQMPYISSGGFGGAVLIAIGVTLLSSFEHARDRAALEVVLDRLDAIDDRLNAMESRQDETRDVIDLSDTPAPRRRATTRRSAAGVISGSSTRARTADRPRSRS